MFMSVKDFIISTYIMLCDDFIAQLVLDTLIILGSIAFMDRHVPYAIWTPWTSFRHISKKAIAVRA